MLRCCHELKTDACWLATDKISFNRFLNRSSSTEVFTGDSLTEVIIPSDILTLSDSLVTHPMVKMYEAESDANAAKLTMVTRMGYPMVGLGLNYMVIQKRDGNASMMNGKDMTMPMVSLTLPIYRKKQKAMRHEAEFMRDAATLSSENVINNLRVNFQQTMQNLNDAVRRVKLYTDQAILADKSMHLLIASFSAGGTDFVEVLRMQQQLLEYQFKQVEAVVDKNTSIARILYLTGNIIIILKTIKQVIMKIKTIIFNKYTLWFALILAGFILGGVIFHRPHREVTNQEQTVQENRETIWTCAMHPQIRMDHPGKCPICGMELIPLIQSTAPLNPDAIVMTEEGIKLAEVQTSFVLRKKPVKEVRLYGKIQADERLIQTQPAHVPGRIEKLLVNFTGEEVQKGQIYCPDLFP